MQNYKVFGFTVSSNYPLIGPRSDESSEEDLKFIYTDSNKSSSDLSEAQVIYRSPYCTKEGEPWISIYQFDDHNMIHYAQRADFHLWPDQIIAQSLDPKYINLIELYLLGSVFSLWLEQQGIPTLHASCVEVGHHAVAFLATKEGGKSTIAAALVQAGYPLIADDVLPIEMHNRIFFGRPAYPQMKLWCEATLHFLGHCHDLALVDPTDSSYIKYKVPIGVDSLFGSFCDRSCPLSAIYLPERIEMPDSDIIIEPVSPRDALIELIRNSFTAGMVEAMALGEVRLKFFADMAMQVPMRRIIYPTGFENISKVRDAILDDLVTLSR